LTILPVSSISSILPSSLQSSSTAGSANFGKFLSDALNQANDLAGAANTSAQTYAAGGPVTLDQVMVDEQKASLALNLVVQVRDRVVSAYQTIMSMQV